MAVDAMFFDIAKMDALFDALPEWAFVEAEAAAIEAVAEFRKSVEEYPTLDTVKEIGHFAMFSCTMSLCSNEALRVQCREAFGTGLNTFVPGVK